MSFDVKIIADSLSPAGARLTTFQLRYPRFIHAEFLTHRAISRNGSSSRAIPLTRRIRDVQADTVEPIRWGKRQAGMQAHEELGAADRLQAVSAWNRAAGFALGVAEGMDRIGLHKQIASRILEPFAHISVVATATESGWHNLFSQRCHVDAQPEFCRLAVLMARAYRDSVVWCPHLDEWHLPYVSFDEMARIGLDAAKAVSVARCARVSYLSHDGEPASIEADLVLAERLQRMGHWSPFEHQARPSVDPEKRSGNLVGWHQYRQDFAGQNRTKFDFSTLEQFES